MIPTDDLDRERTDGSTAPAPLAPSSVHPDETTRLALEPSRVQGEVRVSGAKNSALRLLAASLLFDGTVRISNFPSTLLDSRVHVEMLVKLGKAVDVQETTCTIDGAPTTDRLEWSDRSIRNTLLIWGALAARHGTASVPLPGGCEIGDRRYDLHQGLLEACGFAVSVADGRLAAELRRSEATLEPAVYEASLRSTGVTENALIVGSLRPATTTLINPHLTPEVLDLVGFLRSCGVQVDIQGTHSMTVTGVRHLDGGSWSVIPDRMEAMTWAAAAVASRGEVEILDFPVDDSNVALQYLEAAGGQVYLGRHSIIVKSRGPQPIQMATGSHPAVHSDLQPIFGAVASVAHGTSEIIDLRYPDRFAYLRQVANLGGLSEVSMGRATIRGTSLHGGHVRADDLRAGAALMICAIAGHGPVEMSEAWQIYRGYDRFSEKMAGVGISHRLL